MALPVTRQLWVLLTLGLFLALPACGREAVRAYAAVTPASLSPGSAIPGPTGDVILTISGDIAIRNAGDSLAFDMATLEKLGLVQYTIADPWEGDRQVTYTGVLVSDLIRFAGVSDSATSIHMVALDDYQVDITIADIVKWPVLLATRSNGQYMSVENAGPTRIIFPFHAYPEIDRAVYKNLFIWSLETMHVQ